MVLFCVGVVCSAPAYGAAAEATAEKRLLQEQKKAQKRKTSLKSLTEQERKTNAELARAETRINDVESRLASLQEKLRQLNVSDAQAEKEYAEIVQMQKKTLEAQGQLMRLLWGLTCKKESIGSREMADWDVADREHRWSAELLQRLEQYHAELDEQQKKMAAVLERRQKYSKETEEALEKVNQEKYDLLQTRIKYSQQLSAVRKQKATTEEELTDILKLVDTLNFQIEKAGGDITKQKGKLLWPAAGIIKKRFAPSATPAFRGIGIATRDSEEVRAVAEGKVVHNNVLRGLGTVLILQHGADYYTVYAYLGNSPLKVGETVKRQGRVGTTGFFPTLKGPGVYFELRFRQKAINPEQWLARI